MKERIVPLKSVHNLRTLGGIRTSSGKMIREGILLRSAALDRIKLRDARALTQKYHLSRVIDLRTQAEVQKAPDKTPEGVQYSYIPVCADAIPCVSREATPGRNVTADMLPDLTDMYRSIVCDPGCIEQYSKIIKTILNNRDGAVLWHCTAGKDRCGLTTLFVLWILGVSYDTILEDYLLTNLDCVRTGRKYYWIIRLLKRDVALAEKIYAAYLADGRYLQSAMDAIKAEFGGMDCYIRNQLGISEEEIAAFRTFALE